MEKRLLRFGQTLLLVFTAILLSSDHAAAAIAVEVDPSEAPTGATVVATTVDESLAMIPSGRLALFLAPTQRAADTARGTNDPRLVSIGELMANERCIGRLSFTVPDVAAGKYVLLAHCAECTTGMVFDDSCSPDPELAEQASGPGTFITVGEFTVTAGSRLARTGTSISHLIGGAILLAALGMALLSVQRTRA